MVALDLHRHALAGLGVDVGASALNHIGIERALGEVVKGPKPLALLFKDADEFGTDDAALLLGVSNARELVDEALTSIDVLHIDVETLVEELDQKLGLAFTHEALVDEHARELITDGLVQQKGQG